MVRVRLRRAIESLGGISSKRMKTLEKEHAATHGVMNEQS